MAAAVAAAEACPSSILHESRTSEPTGHASDSAERLHASRPNRGNSAIPHVIIHRSCSDFLNFGKFGAGTEILLGILRKRLFFSFDDF